MHAYRGVNFGLLVVLEFWHWSSSMGSIYLLFHYFVDLYWPMYMQGQRFSQALEERWLYSYNKGPNRNAIPRLQRNGKISLSLLWFDSHFYVPAMKCGDLFMCNPSEVNTEKSHRCKYDVLSLSITALVACLTRGCKQKIWQNAGYTCLWWENALSLIISCFSKSGLHRQPQSGLLEPFPNQVFVQYA